MQLEHTIAICNQRLYLLCQLKKQCLLIDCCDREFVMQLLSLSYCMLHNCGVDISV